MDIGNLIKELQLKGYTVSTFEKVADAVHYLNSIINNKTIGFGDSATLLDMKLFEKLSCNNKVFDPQHCEVGMDFLNTAKLCLTTEIYITSVNAISEKGEIVNIDGTGNRIAGSIFGHKKVYFIVGTNKITPTLETSIWRAQNIAAPQNAMRYGLKTPCAIRGDQCYNCSSPQRICNGMMIHLKKMNDIEMEVILINENLGY